MNFSFSPHLILYLVHLTAWRRFTPNFFKLKLVNVSLLCCRSLHCNPLKILFSRWGWSLKEIAVYNAVKPCLVTSVKPKAETKIYFNDEQYKSMSQWSSSKMNPWSHRPPWTTNTLYSTTASPVVRFSELVFATA